MLEKIAKWLTRKPKLVAMMAVLMLIPAAIGYISTRINYDILSYDELPADEAAMLKADAEEAERGYTDEQLSEALKRTPGRPLAVGSTPASNVIRVRLDDERDAKLERYMRKHHMSRSNAVRTLLDKALAEI